MEVDIDLVEPRRSGEEVEGHGKGGYDHEFGAAKITATVSCEGKTGVEMEALTAANVAGLALYDMLKGVDRGMELRDGRVVGKKGGRSGGWRWDEGLGRVVRDGEGGAGGGGEAGEK